MKSTWLIFYGSQVSSPQVDSPDFSHEHQENIGRQPPYDPWNDPSRPQDPFRRGRLHGQLLQHPGAHGQRSQPLPPAECRNGAAAAAGLGTAGASRERLDAEAGHGGAADGALETLEELSVAVDQGLASKMPRFLF